MLIQIQVEPANEISIFTYELWGGSIYQIFTEKS